MFSEIKSAGLFGLNAFMVTVQASIAPGQPSFDIVGMPDIAVQESKARIRAVLGHLELKLLNGKVTVNLAPADTRKAGTLYDLPVLLGILCAIWRAAAAKRREFLKKEAQDTLTVHYQKEVDREP